MDFIGWDGKLVALRGMHSYPPQKVSAHRMEADLRHGDIAWAIALRISETEGPKKQTHPDILALLEKYQGVFGDIPLGKPFQPENHATFTSQAPEDRYVCRVFRGVEDKRRRRARKTNKIQPFRLVIVVM